MTTPSGSWAVWAGAMPNFAVAEFSEVRQAFIGDSSPSASVVALYNRAEVSGIPLLRLTKERWMDVRRTVVLSASAALAVLLFGAAALLWTQQAQAEEACTDPNLGTVRCLDKTADADTVEVGQQITFTITERCLGEACTVGFGSPL